MSNSNHPAMRPSLCQIGVLQQTCEKLVSTSFEETSRSTSRWLDRPAEHAYGISKRLAALRDRSIIIVPPQRCKRDNSIGLLPESTDSRSRGSRRNLDELAWISALSM